MKTITQYECDFCQNRYYDEERALDCEAQGVFDNSIYPAGLMFPYSHLGFVGIFAIPTPIQFFDSNKHIGHSAYWACRARLGDSLGYELCGGDFFRSNQSAFNLWLSNNHMTDKFIASNEFKRMVEYLKSANIQPSYYDEIGKLHLI